MRYQPLAVNVDDSQEKKLTRAIKNKTGVSLRVTFKPSLNTLLFTKNQTEKIERAKLMGKDNVIIRMSSVQVKANTEHEGGFLWALASKIAPAILTGVMSALASKVTQKVMGSKEGRGLYLQKNDQCAKVDIVKGGGLYLAPHAKFQGGKGLFEADSSKVIGDGFLLGDNSPFKNVPLLNILL